MWRAWSQRRLRAETVDRLMAAVLLVWALFDVPWWWRPPGHGGSAPVTLGVIALAAAQSVPFLWRRRQPTAVLVLAGAALAVKYAAGLNLSSPAPRSWPQPTDWELMAAMLRAGPAGH